MLRGSMPKVLEFFHRPNGVTYPEELVPMMMTRSWDWNVKYYVYDNDATATTGNAGDVLEREIMLSYPVETDMVKMVIAEGADDINMKIELLGMPAKERYNLNPYLDHRIISKST